MRTSLRLLGIGCWMLLGAVLWAGCDSTEDRVPDAELIIGQWRVVGLQDSRGDQTDALRGLGTLDLGFAAGNNFTLTFAPADGSAARSFSGTFTVQEAAKQIVLQGTVGNLPVTLTMTYEVEGEDAVSLVAPVAVINLIAGSEYTGNVTLRIARVG